MLNIFVLGASNSIAKNGYVPRVEVALKRMRVDCSITNLSVGATSCLRGVVPLCSGDVKNADVIILEYSITDMPYLTEVGVDIWRDSYEGLVRTAILSNPNAHIICLILGRSKEKFFERQDLMRNGIYEIAHQYNVSVVDFDAELRSLLPAVDEFESCYKDVAHYSAPLPTSLCAESIAKKIYDKLDSKENVSIKSSSPFDDAKVINFPAFYGQHDNVRVFENSRIKVTTLRLGLGESVELPGEMRVLGIEFVSSTDGCNIRIERGGEVKTLYTLHGKVKTRQFSFLWRFAHTQVGDWSDKKLENWKLSAVSSRDGEPTLYSYGMIANDPKSEKAVYLSRLIYY